MNRKEQKSRKFESDKDGYLLILPASLEPRKSKRNRKKVEDDQEYLPTSAKKLKQKALSRTIKNVLQTSFKISSVGERSAERAWPNSRPMTNRNQICYLNAVLQAFAGVPQFVDYVTSHNHPSKEAHNYDKNTCPVCSCKVLIKSLLEYGNAESTNATQLFKFLEGQNGIIEGQQCDANDCALLLLSILQTSVFYVELETAVTCGSCSYSSIQIQLPENEISCSLPLPKGTRRNPVSVQDCVDRYFQDDNLDDWNCSNCLSSGGTKSISITLAPQTLIVHLKRYEQNEFNQIRKREDFVKVNEKISLKPNLANEVVWYEVRAVVQHKGSSMMTGHYVCSRKVNSGFIVLDDDKPEMRKGTVDGCEPYIIFYEKCDANLRLENLCNVEIDELSNDAFNTSTSNSLDINTQTEVEVLYEEAKVCSKEELSRRNKIQVWKRRYSAMIHDKWLNRNKLLVICLPKIKESNSFANHYKQCLKGTNRILFTITWKGSQFLRQLREDPIIKRYYDVYSKEIGAKMGAYNVSVWFAEAAVCYIMYTHLHRKELQFEYIFDLNPNCVVTTCILRNWVNIKSRIIKSMEHLLPKTSLFCIKTCSRACSEQHHFHRSLSGMELLPPPVKTAKTSSMNRWSFVDRTNIPEAHPLKKLLEPLPNCFDKDINCLIAKYLESSEISSNCLYNVYLLLVVKDVAEHTSEDLYNLWTDNKGKFGIYAGITKDGRFRKAHLLTYQEGGKTAVSKYLNETSTVYLITSQSYSTYNDAALAEAQMIAVLHYKRDESKKTGITLKYEILNKNLPSVPLYESSDENQKQLDEFLMSGADPFRFIKEPYAFKNKEKGILQRFIVSEIVKRPGESKKKHSSKIKKGNIPYLPHHSNITKTCKRFFCSVCSKGFEKMSSLIGHRKIHRTKRFACGVCSKKFVFAQHLKFHMVTHTGERKFRCKVCEKAFKLPQHLSRHMRIHTGQKNHKCCICFKRFSRPDTLKTHMFIHTGQKDFQCKICSKKFRQISALNSHMFTHNPRKKIFKCTKCSKTFGLKQHLDFHMVTHTKEKAFRCEICSKTFALSHQLTRHIRIHTGQKDYKCQICSKRFTRSDGLKSHMRIHTGEKPHKCTICTKAFALSHNLTQHMVTHTGVRNYECKLCNKTFAQHNGLSRHNMKIHKVQSEADNTAENGIGKQTVKDLEVESKVKSATKQPVTGKSKVLSATNSIQPNLKDDIQMSLAKQIPSGKNSQRPANPTKAIFTTTSPKKSFPKNTKAMNRKKT